MTPLFTLTTPNGQTIEGYEGLKCSCGYNLEIIALCNMNCNFRLLSKNSYALSDITEEQAKEWGYEIRRIDSVSYELEMRPHYRILYRNGKMVNAVDGYGYNCFDYLSNILLIVTQN